MKKLKFLNLTGLAFCALILSACGSDNNEDNSTPTPTSKRVTSIKHSDKSSGNVEYIFHDFKYNEKGLVTYYEWVDYDEGVFEESLGNSFKFTNNQIEVESNASEEIPVRLIHTLDENGRISKSTLTDNRLGVKTISYFYNKDNQLVRMWSDNQKIDIKLNWENGNIVRSQVKDSYNPYSSSDYETTTYTYSNLPFFGFSSFTNNYDFIEIGMFNNIDPTLFMEGFFGKCPQNLVESCTSNGSTDHFTYTFDGNKNLKEVIISNKNLKGVIENNTVVSSFTWQ